ncbi:hypothetical protein [Vibrio sp. 10N.261.46.A3]|uniref:hypothetical protein n=1 Tax=Vibrio sp. 10N.261.46.A3 TaxID=3229658 RepID=UPI0035529CDE
MPRKAIQKHTEVVNQLLNHPDVLHPTIRQYYWFNEQDSLDELWLICSSFIADINAALMSPNSPPRRFKKLEAQINYGGVLHDGQPQCSIQINKDAVSDDWLIKLRNSIGAIYACVSPLHANHHVLIFKSQSLQPNSKKQEQLINNAKMQLQPLEPPLELKSRIERYDQLVLEHGAWVASIVLMISLEGCCCGSNQSPLEKTLRKHAKDAQKALKRLYLLTSPFSVSLPLRR